MGSGEDWMGMWSVFLKGLPADRDSRVAYLRRHPPAPFSWADAVQSALTNGDDDDDNNDDDDVAAATVEVLKAEGLIASDVAWHTWRAGPHDATALFKSSPAEAARYSTRDFWFWSRCPAQERERDLAAASSAWRALAGDGVPSNGLEQLAQMLLHGRVQTPWALGLAPSDFTDSFDDDMTFSDAFRLWLMSAFDDREHLDSIVSPVPQAWQAFMDAEVTLR